MWPGGFASPILPPNPDQRPDCTDERRYRWLNGLGYLSCIVAFTPWLMRWPHYICFISWLVAACSAEPPATTPPSTANLPPSTTSIDVATKAAALATPQRFLQWYGPRMDSLNSICLVPAACNADTADVYALDFKQVGNYLAAFSKGGFTSARYAASRRAYYRQQADSMRAHPLYDGAPPGLDFDPVLCSQDSDDLQALLKQTPVILHYTLDSARIGLGLSYDGALEKTLVFRLSHQGGSWLIDGIEPVFPGN